MKEEERKIDCGKYSECLDKVAKKNTRFNCAGCAEYEEPPQTRVDEFEEELIRPAQEGEMTAKGKGSNQGRICDVTGCDKPAYCQGKCMMHYSRLKRGQEVEGPPKKPGRQPKENGTQMNPPDTWRASTEDADKTNKKRGAYKPKGPKDSGQSSVNSDQMAKAVEMLIQCGFLKREKLAAAMELVKE